MLGLGMTLGLGSNASPAPAATQFGTPYSLGFNSSGAASSTVTLTVGADVPIGAIIVVFAVIYNTSVNIVGCTDSNDGSDTTDWAGNTQNSASTFRLRMFWKKVSAAMTSGVSTITVSTSSSTANTRNIFACAFTGGDTIDISSTGNVGTNGIATTALGTLAANDEMVICAVRADSATATSDSTGYSFIGSSASTHVSYRIVTSNASDSPVFNITGGTGVWGIQAMSFTKLA